MVTLGPFLCFALWLQTNAEKESGQDGEVFCSLASSEIFPSHLLLWRIGEGKNLSSSCADFELSRTLVRRYTVIVYNIQ